MRKNRAKREAMFVVKGPVDDGEQLYWSNEDGWVSRESATRFSQEEREDFDAPLPEGAVGWEAWKV